MKIELAVSCVWFQRRLCFQLSSVLQQIGDRPEIVVNVAYPPQNGSPTTEEVCSYFSNLCRFQTGLQLKETMVEGDDIKFRGIVRNRQLAESDADWILFADVDMVYAPDFFEDLAKQLTGPFKDETRCLSASRTSLAKDFCKDFFNKGHGSTVPYPCEIADVAQTIADWPRYKERTRNVGAGYFQLANVQNLRNNHGGLYWKPDARRDPSWGYRSDRQFRRMLGGISSIETKPQYHLNHERDSEEGQHVEVQR